MLRHCHYKFHALIINVAHLEGIHYGFLLRDVGFEIDDIIRVSAIDCVPFGKPEPFIDEILHELRIL